MRPIRTIILDDEIHSCERLKRLLIPFTQIRVIGFFTNSKKGLGFIIKEKPDLIFLDIELENNISAFDIIDQLNISLLHPHIIMVTAYPQYSIKAIKHDIFDYLLKPVDVDELKKTMDRYLSHISSIPVRVEHKFNMLSKREIHILKYILEGKKSDEIADLLFISINTVHKHRQNILKKTRATSVLDLFRLSHIGND
jgi:DNA-binding NarL/FixJ family response regulator